MYQVEEYPRSCNSPDIPPFFGDLPTEKMKKGV
jgi:hypothetical protein